MKMRFAPIQLLFCDETGDDSAAELKSSSFNEDISASLLLLIVGANRVSTDPASATAPTSISIPIPRMRFNRGEN